MHLFSSFFFLFGRGGGEGETEALRKGEGRGQRAEVIFKWHWTWLEVEEARGLVGLVLNREESIGALDLPLTPLVLISGLCGVWSAKSATSQQKRLKLQCFSVTFPFFLPSRSGKIRICLWWVPVPVYVVKSFPHYRGGGLAGRQRKAALLWEGCVYIHYQDLLPSLSAGRFFFSINIFFFSLQTVGPHLPVMCVCLFFYLLNEDFSFLWPWRGWWITQCMIVHIQALPSRTFNSQGHILLTPLTQRASALGCLFWGVWLVGWMAEVGGSWDREGGLADPNIPVTWQPPQICEPLNINNTMVTCASRSFVAYKAFSLAETKSTENQLLVGTLNPLLTNHSRGDCTSWRTTYSWQKVLNFNEIEPPVTKGHLSRVTIPLWPIAQSWKIGSTV